MFTIGVNIYEDCKDFCLLFDVLLITSSHDKCLLFLVDLCDIYDKLCPELFEDGMRYNHQKTTQR